MKIARITATEVVVPARPGVIESVGMNKPLHKLPFKGKPGWSVQFDQVQKIILEVEMDNGLVGLGECYRGPMSQTIEDYARILLGRDLFSLPLQRLPLPHSREYDGFECAIYDAVGKARGLRVADLLGGPVRELVRVGAWSSHRRNEEIGAWAKSYRDQGYDCIKFKCDLDDDVGFWCRAIADAAPGMQIILDPNERWETAGNARGRLRELEAIGNVLCVEEPIPRWNLSEYARLRQFSAVPIALHVSLPYVQHAQKIQDATLAIRQDAADGFNFNGGAANFQRLDHLAVLSSLPCWHGSEIDLGILEARYVHSCAAAESAIWPSDIFGRMIRSHCLLKSPLVFEPPHVRLPSGPGLGVDLDRDALKEFAIARHEIH